ncbi:dipeptide/tripeptide permease [Encephalitozoon intestinalis ATCC 50506]|uniref:Dipeptide/tripeptide permease n=1 Tax=Encephalitozoon intestinalis (strain ATCC 50506) TaxID=876142 RepID=E0S9X0_ENCIT|nr:dipeptide/tripeptide permease [Encephalitozoon intestinalis ATCC 50506]ADM12592.1 dipeptide/tripeptide permease [Encephalitozoon intestinalis ATCC 50506]UTX46449.1 nitrate transporter [Encephalitozoon intestinalis]
MNTTTMNRTTLFLIICNEFCERFCFYGLKSLLFSFAKTEYNFSIKASTMILHFFISMSYLFTLLGALLADRFLGRYNTILVLSPLYLTGTSILTYCSVVSGSPWVLMASLAMVAVGTGGIKPCIATFGGDQFGPNEAEGLRKFFDIFYFVINIGSMVSMMLVPAMSNVACLGKLSCYPLAFGMSSALLGASIFLFVAGEKLYVIKPARKEQFSNEFRFLVENLKSLFQKRPESCEEQTQESGKTAAEAVSASHSQDTKKRIWKILKILGPAMFFWTLSDQQSSSWVEQGQKMGIRQSIFGYGVDILPSQMQALNPIFILFFIPIFSGFVYPLLGWLGVFSSREDKMGLGIVFGSLAFFYSGYLEHRIVQLVSSEEKLSILWQVPQYAIMTVGEIMLNVTGMEYMYVEAPETMKSLALSMWLLAVAVGNLLIMALTFLDPISLLSSHRHDMWSFAMYGALGLVASSYMFKTSRSNRNSKG